MRRKGMVLLAIWTLLSPFIAVGVTARIAEAAASDECTSGPILEFGRRRWCGYFKNQFNDSGEAVRNGGVPASVSRAAEFIQLIENDLASSSQHRRTGAQFVVLTMLGRGPGAPQSVSPTQLEDWRERVGSYANISENDNQSFGENGRIDWFVSQHTPCGIVNTYYQVPQNDVAPFIDHADNSDCEVPSSKSTFIIFRDTSGNQQYMIRRECMNPMGDLKPLTKRVPNYNLNPTITTTVDGGPLMETAEVGNTIQFTYRVVNNGTTVSDSTNCTIYGNVRPGYASTPSPPTSSSSPGFVPPPTSCPFILDDGDTTTVATETFVVSTGDQTICRSLFVTPATPAGISRGIEACVPIANKPYMRVFGGDIIAGGGLGVASGSCATNTNAAIVGWNKRASSFAGAGTQFAALALSTITDFASSLGNPASSAPEPSGLTFANTATSAATGQFGGSFGSAPCMRDYYAGGPSSALALPATASELADNATYTGNGNVTLGGGTIPADTQTTVYVKGNLYIAGNIQYGGTWDLRGIPRLQIIVEGNIFVAGNVTRLDGLYVAQQEATGVAGEFYTCASTSSPFTPLPLDGSLHSQCNTKLTVNGSVVAHRIMLLRTRGSLSQSTVSESSGSSSAGEEFNYGPAFWVPQPPAPAPADYDAIRSLPPIL